jgi:hypothetical protein
MSVEGSVQEEDSTLKGRVFIYLVGAVVGGRNRSDCCEATGSAPTSSGKWESKLRWAIALPETFSVNW